MRLVQRVEKRDREMAGRRRHENGEVEVAVAFNDLDAKKAREDIGERLTCPALSLSLGFPGC